MKTFLGKNFLLTTDTSKHLYHDFAKDLPIIDYHCHLSPKEIYENVKYENITQVWLNADHYKWRAMRSAGIDEKYITGDASDYDKFYMFAKTLELSIGNPLYHWSHLELKRYFGYDGYLSTDTAKEVWKLTKKRLKDDNMSAQGLILSSNVEALCTTDDPADDLKYHKLIKDSGFKVKVLPAWRPDKAVDIEKDSYLEYIKLLSNVSNTNIVDFKSLMDALKARLEFFNDNGCRISDHGMSYVCYVPYEDKEIDSIIAKKLNGESISEVEALKYRTAILTSLGREYSRLNWSMQLHFGVIRNLNSRIYDKCGADSGIDAISGEGCAAMLGQFLDALDKTNELPQTIIYSLNPTDNAMIDTVMGCFQNSSSVGKIQHGSAWWFNDHKEGMLAQLKSLSSMGVLGTFVGMLTDSRSFLSYTRHEYFRRILCEYIGNLVENGEYPNDDKALKKIVEGMSYYNAKDYFNL